MMNVVGGSETFRIFGILALILSVVHYIVQLFLEKYSTEPGKEIAHTVTQEKYTYNGGDALGIEANKNKNAQTPIGNGLIS